MTVGLAFWILMLIWLVWGGYQNRASFGVWLGGGDLLIFVLIGLLGWHAFGAPIRG